MDIFYSRQYTEAETMPVNSLTPEDEAKVAYGYWEKDGFQSLMKYIQTWIDRMPDGEINKKPKLSISTRLIFRRHRTNPSLRNLSLKDPNRSSLKRLGLRPRYIDSRGDLKSVKNTSSTRL